MASRRMLALTAGAVWMAVGIGLIGAAIWWLTHAAAPVAPEVSLGLIGGLLIARFKLSRLAVANIRRIAALAPGEQRVALIRFQSRRSYLVIVLMIAMGYALRHSSIPRLYLAPLYLAMGLGLFIAALHYFRPPGPAEPT